ncbi:glycosyl hydrolase family 3 N terminal domain-containing protein [Microdochium trichocladiopsis]|uniref:beta-glucosidase n=1 Tax=Microdochium trichocladiopsis TaxID=1682393 RepID=A0A9P8Y1Z5_9PEZI|nr:glycosyl hydrolase family 3 N terminal domain-containing protein [Microdochium trichocladiopsis]KAH7025702.1 glycosyl hydrolase family 3 N terminal domain-containing protein [Microdochium trichocladiopsis]
MSPFLSDVPAGLLDVDELLAQLTVEEKVALLTGRDMWHTTPLPLRGIPSIRVSDGPNGVRGTKIFDGVPSSCLPCGTALGATFDPDLLAKLGQLQGQEAKAKGAVAVLGPTLNIQRGPLGGRGFESFSEDPVLSGLLAGHYARGLQQEKVAATLKHFVCNDMEHERMAVNVLVTPRALREIYLLPFMLAISIGDPRAIMTAYNKVNGTHVSESKGLLQDILRDEWKYDGLVMSDWWGTYSTTGAIQAGLDLEMPGPARWRGAVLSHAVMSNKVTVGQLDDRVRNVLGLINYSAAARVPENAPEEQLNRAEDRALLRRAASESIVLLKNDDNRVLPFSKGGKTTAVIGPNAKTARFCGGGSASLLPYYSVSPYEGIAAKLGQEPRFAQGSSDHRLLPLLGDQLRTGTGGEGGGKGGGEGGGQRGFTWRAYNEPPTVVGRRPVDERVLTDSNCFFLDYEHPDLAPVWYCQAEGTFTPAESGVYDFGLGVEGTGRLYVDDELVVSNVENQKPGTTLFGAGTVEETGSKALVAGRDYRVRVEWGCSKTSKLPSVPPVGGQHGGLRFGAARRIADPARAIAEAAALAAQVDQVVLVVGLNGELESEGVDRTDMGMTAQTDALVAAVLAANPNTAVVIQSGTPVGMPWIDQANAVCQAWYGGNETGNAIADVLFGDVNPSGKLPLTFPRRVEDNPAYVNFRSEAGRVLYGEDVYVGYRYYDKTKTSPLFPFGHGLSYSTFALQDLVVVDQQQEEAGGSNSSSSSETSTAAAAAGVTRITLQISNTGSRGGAEVVQVYVAPPAASSVGRPVKELKAVHKVYLEAGQRRSVSIELDTVLATSYWDEGRSQWCSEAGEYKVLVGTSSADTPLEAALRVGRTRHWTGIKP